MKSRQGKHRTGNRFLIFAAALSAAALLQPLWTCMAASGDEIVSIDFDDGGTDGFTVYTNGGVCELKNEDGALQAVIASCGKLDYANQAYWDGFALMQDCEYTYSFDISCDIDREIEYRLQLNGGDYHAYLGERIAVGPQLAHVSADWVMTEESDPAPRLVFNMGYMDTMEEDPGEHTVTIDNIMLTIRDDSKAVQLEEISPAPFVTASQIGYRSEDVKTVFVRCQDTPADHFSVEKENGEIVFEQPLEEPFYDSASGAMMQRGDFTMLEEEGIYRIRVAGEAEEEVSAPFAVGRKIYDDVMKKVFAMFYLQRCGTEIVPDESKNLADYAHPACHMQEALVYGSDARLDASGGWHDAGDYGRYVVSGVKAAADLLLSYEQFGMDSDDLGIPESGNGIPDVLDEVRWELEWMLKMQDKKSGGVFHKVTCRSFPGEVMPQDETEELVLSPVSRTAAGDFAALMAKSARIYRAYDADFAKRMLDAAVKAWNYGKDIKDSTGFTNPEDITTGEYPDRSADDEYFWAAVELCGAGVLEYDAVEEKFAGYLRPGLGWQRMTSYGLISLAADENAPGDLRERAVSMLTEEAEEIFAAAEKDGYYMALGTEYPWGSNMTVADNGMLLLIAARLTGSDEYAALAKKQLDYLLGANPAGYCYVSGCGETSPEHPHHRPSQAAGHAMPGMLAGGPNSHLEDPFAKGVLSDRAPALCYADNEQSYSTNETAVYWNSPLFALLSGI